MKIYPPSTCWDLGSTAEMEPGPDPCTTWYLMNHQSVFEIEIDLFNQAQIETLMERLNFYRNL